MSSNNRLLAIYTCSKPRMYHNWQLYYLLATVPVLQKHSKYEEMLGCIYSFILLFMEWMATTGIAN